MRISIAVILAVIIAIGLLAFAGGDAYAAIPAYPAPPQSTPTRAPWVITPPVWQLTPTAVIDAHGKAVGLQGQIGCYDCSPFKARVRLSNYDPNKGGSNCWDFSDKFQWCMSDMRSGLPWESFYGLAAACPFDWPYGTWVEIPGVGSFICLDRGGSIICDYESGICNVDILAPYVPGGLNGAVIDVTLWVPLKPRD